MIRLLFLSYGTSPEPPMATYIMTHLVKEAQLTDRITVASASLTKLISPLCQEGDMVLAAHHIPMEEEHHFPLEWKSYDQYDFILLMDTSQQAELFNILGGDVDEKFHLLSDYATTPISFSNPYQSHNFEDVFEAENACCLGLLKKLESWIR